MHTGISQFEGEQAPDTSHTLIQRQQKCMRLPWLLKTEFLQPFINTRRWTGGTSVSDTDPWPHESPKQHWPPLTTAWEPLLRVRPKASGSEELNSSDMKAQGQSNFKLVYKPFLDCWLFQFQTPGSQRFHSHLLLSTHTFFSSPPNKSASKWLRHL